MSHEIWGMARGEASSLFLAAGDTFATSAPPPPPPPLAVTRDSPYSGFVVALPSLGGGGERDQVDCREMPTARENRISLLRRTGIFPAPSPPPPSTCSTMKRFHFIPPCVPRYSRKTVSHPSLFLPPPLTPMGRRRSSAGSDPPSHDCRRRRGGGRKRALLRRHHHTPPIARYRANCFLSLSLSCERKRGQAEDGGRRTEDDGSSISVLTFSLFFATAFPLRYAAVCMQPDASAQGNTPPSPSPLAAQQLLLSPPR